MRIAIIPARGGSKRIPRKNIREFQGKPLIGHVIHTARTSGLFERVVVSTDDDEIAMVARRYGAETPFKRPSGLSDDYTGTTEVVAHAIETLQMEADVDLSAVCCIYATAVFLRCSDLMSGLQVFESSECDYVFSATTFAAPVARSFWKSDDGGLNMFFPDQFDTRSQDLEEGLHDAGQFYWGRTEAWLRKARMFGRRSKVVEIPRWRVQDIDTEEDWVRAECIASYLDQLQRNECDIPS